MTVRMALRTLVLLAGTALFSPSHAAEVEWSHLHAQAGVQGMLRLSCTPVNLGVWRVPVRDSGGSTTIMLGVDDPEGGFKLFGQTAGVALATQGPEWAGAFGVCTVSGSRALNGTTAKVSISENRFMRVTGDGVTFSGLSAPQSVNAAIRIDIFTVTAVTIQDGGATFLVGGGLTIPQRIRAEHYGGYRTTTKALITVDDRLL